MAVKPLLMLTLLLHFVSVSSDYPPWRYWVIAALMFSWAGDVLLMKDELFVIGLASFLLAQVCYIIAYQNTGASTGLLKRLDVVKFTLFGVLLIWIILPGLDGMLFPVLLYTLVLLTMAVWAHKRRHGTSTGSFTLVASGVTFFVLSDSMIAINKFALELPFERILVMSSYLAAQYLIVQGLLKHKLATES